MAVAQGPPGGAQRRMALAVGLSLAGHLAITALLLTWVVEPAGRPTGAGEPAPLAVAPGDEASEAVGIDVVEEAAAGGIGEAGVTAGPAPGAPSPGRRRRGPPAAHAPGPRGNAPVRVAQNEPPGLAPDASVTPRPPTAGTTPAAEPGHEARTAFRRQLRRHMHEAWNAQEVYQRIDPHHRLQGSLFTTTIELRLRPDGSIERTSPAESSGVIELDKEALGALKRMRPLPAVPPQMLDAQGGLTVRSKFLFDVGYMIFAARLRAAIADIWRPSRAFASTAEQERTTVLRLTLGRDGKLAAANVAVPSGLDLLDKNALEALAPGTSLPPPPPALTRQPGPAQVMVAFLHKAGEVRMLKPRDDIEEE